jgi:hypothetical protein
VRGFVLGIPVGFWLCLWLMSGTGQAITQNQFAAMTEPMITIMIVAFFFARIFHRSDRDPGTLIEDGVSLLGKVTLRLAKKALRIKKPAQPVIGDEE